MESTGNRGAPDGQNEQDDVQPETALELARSCWNPEGRVERLERKRGSAVIGIVGRKRQLPSDVLEVLAGLESNRAAGRNAHFFAGPWVTADSALARFHLEHAEPAQ